MTVLLIEKAWQKPTPETCDLTGSNRNHNCKQYNCDCVICCFERGVAQWEKKAKELEDA